MGGSEVVKPGMEKVRVEGTDQIWGANPKTLSSEILGEMGHVPLPLLRVIRNFCIECCGGDRTEARRCVAVRCQLWPYRLGKNPFRQNNLDDERRAELSARARRTFGRQPSD